MKYKKKLGGSDIAIPQPNKPPLNSPTVSDSVTGTFNSVKDVFNSSIVFIKTNFIGCLLVGVLLVVYIGLYFTDTLTKEELDKQNEVAKIKCDSYTTPCPPGKKRIDTKDCVDNECDEETCCINDVDCSTYTNTCPDNKTVKTDNKCTTEVCTAEDCCSVNCSSYNTPCPSEKINNPSNICAGDTCTATECCDDKYTCLSGSNSQAYDCNAHNKVLKPYPNTIVCPISATGDGCDHPLCCEPIPSKCDIYQGCIDNGLKPDASNISCPVAGCDIPTCCNDTSSDDSPTDDSPTDDSPTDDSPTGQNVMCPSDFICPTGTASNTTISCPSTGCDETTCCQQN